MSESEQERTEEATPKRKEQARKQGTVAKSTELSQSLVLLAIGLCIPILFQQSALQYVQSVKVALSHLPNKGGIHQINEYLSWLLPSALLFLVPLLMLILIVGVLSNIAQVGFHVVLDSIKPSFNKLNPMNGLKRIFSREALLESFKATFKIGIFSYLAYSVILSEWEKLINLYQVPPLQSMSLVGDILLRILFKLAIAWLILAVVDYAYQKNKIRKQIMMTKEELKQEMKEQEMSPEIRSARARRRRQLLKARMADNVAQSDAIITNPTHFSVAIRYDRDEMHAPMVVAKGVDFLALRIREIAKKNKVPLIENPPLARSLYKECEVGDMVPREHYQVIADILAFVYRTAKKHKRL